MFVFFVRKLRVLSLRTLNLKHRLFLTFLSHAGNQATFLSVAETNVLNDFLNYFGLTGLKFSLYRLSQPM